MPNVQAIAAHCREVLRDAGADEYSDQLLYDAIYNGETAIAMHRGDATARDIDFSCQQGTRQSLAGLTSPAVHQLMSVDYNGSQASPGAALYRVAKDNLDAMTPNWHSATPGNVAEEYTYDERSPLLFYVNPPVVAGHPLKLVVSAVPDSYGTVDANTETTVSDVYQQALIEFCLYVAFSSDTEGTPNLTRAQQHGTTFASLIGINWQQLKALSPKKPEYGK